MVRYHNDLRRELEALKKKADGVFGRDMRSRRTTIEEAGPGRAKTAASGRGPQGALEKLVPGEQVECHGEVFYRVLVEAKRIWDDAEAFHRGYLETLSDPFPVETRELESLAVLRDVSPEEVCYLDLETTGLRMVPLFLVGLMYSDGERLVVDQLFARDYTEERAVLCFVTDFLEHFKIIVRDTFKFFSNHAWCEPLCSFFENFVECNRF